MIYTCEIFLMENPYMGRFIMGNVRRKYFRRVGHSVYG